jgi:hypothetical protein
MTAITPSLKAASRSLFIGYLRIFLVPGGQSSG